MSKEARILLSIIVIDLIITVFLITTGIWTERAALLSWYIQKGGILALCSAKLFLSLCGIIILEFLRSSKKVPKNEIVGWYHLAIAFYVFLYSYMITSTNLEHLL